MRSTLCTSILTLLACIFPAAEDAKAQTPKQDYADFSRLIHKMVVKQLPKEFEDYSAWGQMVPLTEPVRFPRIYAPASASATKRAIPTASGEDTKPTSTTPTAI